MVAPIPKFSNAKRSLQQHYTFFQEDYQEKNPEITPPPDPSSKKGHFPKFLPESVLLL